MDYPRNLFNKPLVETILQRLSPLNFERSMAYIMSIINDTLQTMIKAVIGPLTCTCMSMAGDSTSDSECC